ncbi:MAG: DUF2304 domain-containing protein [Clostridiales bacterium]|nr:DUF2304 domain-containing protein [Clostridiales bacterium]
MPLRLTITIAICAILGIITVISLMAKKKLEYKYGLGWIVVALIIMILGIFPKLLELVAHAMGIAIPANAMFYMGFIFVLIVVFSLSISVSKLSEKVRRLSQDLGILRKDVLDLEKQLEKKNEEK